MGRHNYVQELEYQIAKGLDTTSPASLLGPGFVRNARNCNIGTTGGYSKRDGSLRQLSTPWAGGLAIRNGIEYRGLTGNPQRLFFGTNDVSVGKFGKDSGGAIVDIVSGLDATKRLAFAQFEERLYCFNGDTANAPFVYEGVSTRTSLGLAAPAAEPANNGQNAIGGSLTEGVYIYAYTYALRYVATQRIVAESSPSDLQTITLTTGNNHVILGVVASGAVPGAGQEIVIRVWRTVSGGSVPFLEDIIANTTGNHDSILADAALETQQMEFDNSLLIAFGGYSNAKFPVIARNRLFVAHENRNEIRFSKIGQDGPLPESFPALNYASVEGIHGSSDKVVGLTQINGVPIVLKERSIGRLEEVGLPEISQAEDFVTYIYREISQTVGATSHFATIQVFDEVVFMSTDNVYATNGQTVRPIAPLIQATIRGLDFRINPNKKQQVSMSNDTKNRRIYIQVFENQATAQPTFTLVGDYQQYPDFRWTFYSAGSNSVTHPGLRIGSFFQFTNSTDGSLETYFGNSNGDGQYYKMNTGTFDDNNSVQNGIFFKLVSRPYAMEQPLITKLYKNVRIFAEAADDTYDLEFCATFDLSVEEEFCELFEIPGVGNKWDGHNWVDDPETEPDPLIWAGPALAELTYDPHRKAKFMQLVFNQTEKNAPVTLLGWGVSGSIFSGL